MSQAEKNPMQRINSAESSDWLGQKSAWKIKAKSEIKLINLPQKSSFFAAFKLHFAADFCANTSSEEDGTAVRFGVSQPGDHICLHRELQTGLLPPPAVYSLFILHNEQPKASLSCWRRGCLQEEQAVNWAAPQQSLFPSRWPADCLQPSGCQENCDKANVRSCGAFWMFLTPSICFPAWLWQRSCVGLIGCLSSPGRG